MKALRTNINLGLIAGALSLCSASAQSYQPDVKPQEQYKNALRFFSVPEIRDEHIAEARQYYDNSSARFLDWSPEGEMLIAKRVGEVFQLFKLKNPTAPAEQLTFSQQSIQRGQFGKLDGEDGIVFSRDQDGDENYQYFFRSFSSAEHLILTPESGRHSNAVVSRDLSRIAFTRAQHMENEKWGVLIRDLKAEAGSKTLFQDPGAWAILDWSFDSEKLLLLQFRSIHDSNLYIADRKTGVKAPFDADASQGGYVKAKFSDDGLGVYFLSNLEGEFLKLFYKPFSGPRYSVTEEISWNIVDFDVAPNQELIAYSINEGGIFELVIKRRSDGQVLFRPTLPKGQISNLQFSPDSRQLAFTLNSATSGQGVYSVILEDGALQSWGLPPSKDHAVAPEIIEFPTFDSIDGKKGSAARTIPAHIYKPTTAGPHPVIIRFHGGPESQWVAGYSDATQYWVHSLDVAVIKPNIRGSTGYGRRFAALDNERKREDALKDVGALLDWIETQPDLDASKVMVQGGSYGGYMALASLVHHGDRLKGGINIVGISNFVTFLESTGSFRRELRRAEYGDESDPDMRVFLNSISPLTHVDMIKKPLLIAQGANDPRVPESESQQIVDALRTQGSVVWYILAKNEGHGFERRYNRDRLNAASALFIRKYLLSDRD